MTQQERTKRTRARILEAALVEFGTKSYDAASINTICNENNLSKGLLYHNFKNKDELYLRCVKACYDELMGCLKAQWPEKLDAPGGLRRLLELRQSFFEENPYYANIFFQSLLQPPKHLRGEIQEIRREFEELNTKCYQEILGGLSLRKGITEELALECFSIFQEMFNGYFRSKADQGGDYHALVQDHEGKLTKVFDIILYGIAERQGNEEGLGLD